MEYFFFPARTKKEIHHRFNGLEPEKFYEPSDILGNYEWLISCHSIIPVSEGLKIKAIAESKLGRLFFDDSNIIPFEEFLSFLIKNYQGWAPYAKGMEMEKAKAYANKLIKSFLSCPPEEAVYVRYDGAEKISDPYLINGVCGIFDPINKEFFELVMGGTD